MCICHTNAQCPCYRDAHEYRAEQARQDCASRIEHEVFAVLCDAAAPVSPLAIRLADLIRAHPLTDGGTNIVDVLATDTGIYFWIAHDGSQHYAPVDRPAIRLAA